MLVGVAAHSAIRSAVSAGALHQTGGPLERRLCIH
jgi:hypothetical protein